MLWILEPSFPDHLRGVISAIESGDEDAAAEITRTYYERVDRQLLTLLRTTLARPRRAVRDPERKEFADDSPTDDANVEPSNEDGETAPT